jgi:hypothetical protein
MHLKEVRNDDDDDDDDDDVVYINPSVYDFLLAEVRS